MKKLIFASSILLASYLLPTVALAADASRQQVESNAEINLVEDPNGPLRFSQMPEIDFGVRKISGNNADYRANYLPANSAGKYRANYVQVVDNRGTNQGWQVQASASPFETKEGIVLEKTQLVFSATGAKKLAVDPLTQVVNQEDETPVTSLANWDFQSEQTITNTPKTLISAGAGQGMGVHNLYLGQESAVPSNDEEVATQNESIVLKVPGEVTKEKATYTSVVTWVLLDEPSI